MWIHPLLQNNFLRFIAKGIIILYESYNSLCEALIFPNVESVKDARDNFDSSEKIFLMYEKLFTSRYKALLPIQTNNQAIDVISFSPELFLKQEKEEFQASPLTVPYQEQQEKYIKLRVLIEIP